MKQQNNVLLKVLDEGEALDTFFLVNPEPKKLEELKQLIEHRFDYEDKLDELSPEEIAQGEELVNNIWDRIHEFINANFVVLDVQSVYEIEY